MSFQRDLDEYSEQELTSELTRRAALRANGLCDYCGRDGKSTPCRFTDRHAVAAKGRLSDKTAEELQALGYTIGNISSK